MSRRGHEPPYLNEHRLHCKLSLPGRYAWELGEVDFSIGLIDTRNVDFGQKGDLGWLIGVVWSALDLE